MKATKTMRFFQKSSSDSGCLVVFRKHLQGPLEYLYTYYSYRFGVRCADFCLMLFL